MTSATKFWNGIAEKYARSPIKDMPAYDYTMERTRSYLAQTDKVLELGCGTGTTALRLSDYVGHLTATDLAPEMIRIANNKLTQSDQTNITFKTMHVDQLAAEKESYDVVMAFNLLHLLKDIKATLENAHAMIRPGGYFISKTVCNPGRSAPLKFRLIKMILPLMQLIGKAPYVNFLEIAELEELVESAGFRIIETGNYPAAPPCRFIVAQKVQTVGNGTR